MRRYGMVLLGVMVALTALSAQAQWKWKDNKGQVHVSDLPPPSDVPDKDVLSRPNARTLPTRAEATPAAPAGSSAARARVEPALEGKRKQAEQEQASKDEAEAQKQAALRADNCQRARSTLATLDSGVRVARTNEKGEREFLDDKQRADEAQRARQIIASDCR